MIEITNLYKNIGENKILKNINLKVPKGSIFGLIGENGAGKTTLIKCLTGIYQVDSGAVLIDNKDVFENVEVKSCIGYVSDENSLLSYFKVKELLDFYNMTYTKFSIEKFNKLNNIFKIPIEKRIRELSKGMKTKVSLMLSLSINPKVVILDEPTTGLDPVAKKNFMNILMDEVAENETTVFISSHNLADIERICDSIALIKNGEIIVSSSLDNIKEKTRKIQIIFKDSEKAINSIKNWNSILNFKNIGRVYYLVTNDFSQKFQENLENLGVEFMEFLDLDLEEIFICSVEDGDKNEIQAK